jgi:hypothetical protein
MNTDKTEERKCSFYPCHPCNPWSLGLNESVRSMLTLFASFPLFKGLKFEPGCGSAALARLRGFDRPEKLSGA